MKSATKPKRVIVVAGLACFNDKQPRPIHDPMVQEFWYLQPFQLDEIAYYIAHIRAGVELLGADPEALLIFSGGRTRPGCSVWSEAASYQAIAEYYGYWEANALLRTGLASRCATETAARDSLDNVQYSLYRFYQITGTYPEHVTVVGWEFKRQRFDFHRQTIGIPPAQFSYIGCNDPEDRTDAATWERATLALFRQDPWAEREPLRSKKLARNPYNDPYPYADYPRIVL